MIVVPLGFMVVQLGMISATRRVTMELDKCQVNELLRRHMIGDWGDIDGEAWQANDEALMRKHRVVSSYFDRRFQRFMVVTEADRSRTTILLPEEY